MLSLQQLWGECYAGPAGRHWLLPPACTHPLLTHLHPQLLRQPQKGPPLVWVYMSAIDQHTLPTRQRPLGFL